MEQEINEIMEDLGLELLFSEKDPIDESQLDANGLSRRPPEDDNFDEVKMLRKKPSSGLVLAEESRPLAKTSESYDSYVEKVRENSVSAFSGVRQSLQKSAQRSKRYYDIGVKPKRFEVGQWVLYFNPRKFRGKQNKWMRQYEGPYLVIATPTSLTTRIQRSAKTKLKTVHVDKLKAYEGNPPKGWILPISSVDQNDELEIIGDVDSIPEVSESSAKALEKRHLEKSFLTSVNLVEVWYGGGTMRSQGRERIVQ